MYASVTAKDNTARYSREFLAKHGGKRPAAFTVGDAGSLDPGETSITEEGNHAEHEGAADVQILAAKHNGKDQRNRAIPLPAARSSAKDAQIRRSAQ